MPTIPKGYGQIEGTERKPAHGARLVGPADPNERLTVSIRMRRRPDAPPLPTQEDWAATPPGARKYVSRTEFANRYGAAQPDIDRVLAFAAAHALTVVETSIPRRTVVLLGTVAQMNKAFGVTLGQYETATEKYRGREGYVYLPAELANLVVGAFGLDNRRMARRMGGGAQSYPSLTPVQVARLYNFPRAAVEDGAIGKQTIGLLEFCDDLYPGTKFGYWLSDIQAYFTTGAGIGPNFATPVLIDQPVDMVSNSPAPGSSDDEVVMDIDVAGAVAQGAKIVVYFAPGTIQGWHDAICQSVHDATNAPSVISISYGNPELSYDGINNWTQAAIENISATFQEAAALGVTVLASSGDGGSACIEFPIAAGKSYLAHVNYPASDPWVTGCGGTMIENVAGNSFTEGTWNVGSLATGGGISDVFDLPSWQAGASVPQSVNTYRQVGGVRQIAPRKGRGVPDIAGYANGYSFVYGGVSKGPFPGTSETAPLYAGLIALINARLGTSVGYLNPTLYALAGAGAGMFLDAIAAAGAGVFRDIADGQSNAISGYGIPGYTAVAGWDACTGLGVLDGDNLLRALQTVHQIWLGGKKLTLPPASIGT